MGRLEGKCALVTGGGRGIGAATALALAREGARVGIMGKGETSLAKMKSDAAAQRLAIETFLGDVGSKHDALRTIEAFVAKFGRIDVLVNNAGMAINRPFAEKSVEDVNEVLRVNFVGTFLMSQAAARPMRNAGSGKIVNVASVCGVEHCGREGVMDYSAAKAAVISLTKNWHPLSTSMSFRPATPTRICCAACPKRSRAQCSPARTCAALPSRRTSPTQSSSLLRPSPISLQANTWWSMAASRSNDRYGSWNEPADAGEPPDLVNAAFKPGTAVF
jgi:NAD(P)-dependent dehydrogenase (short-subunit alcohol dehydrogenase family)